MMGRAGGRARPRPGSPWRLWLGILGTLGLVALAFVIAVVVWSGASLASDPSALALLSVGPFGGTVESVHAFGPAGRPILLSIVEGRLIPRAKLSPGERVSIEAVVRRPGWDGWALGSTSREHLTIDAPVAQVGSRWLTVAPGSAPRVRFDQPVAAVAYEVDGRTDSARSWAAHRWVTLGSRSATGSTLVAFAPRSWERLGRPVRVMWFPASSTPMIVASPAPGAKISPTSTIELTFSKPVSEVLGSALPKLSPSTPGRWHAINSHTLVFSPSGFGAALASQLHVTLPHAIAVTGPAGGSLGQTSQLSMDRSRRLDAAPAAAAGPGGLSAAGMDARPGAKCKSTPAAEVQAAVAPPAGSFSWRYASTPSALKALWSQGEANTVTKGAVMTFEREHDMTTDGVAGGRYGGR